MRTTRLYRTFDVARLKHVALAEHYAISKTPLARGLRVINTERATVPMRYVLYEPIGYLVIDNPPGRRSTPKAVS
jgi:hypothetical protein